MYLFLLIFGGVIHKYFKICFIDLFKIIPSLIVNTLKNTFKSYLESIHLYAQEKIK